MYFNFISLEKVKTDVKTLESNKGNDVHYFISIKNSGRIWFAASDPLLFFFL